VTQFGSRDRSVRYKFGNLKISKMAAADILKN